MGATVIAGASSPAKLEVAKSLGADHCVNYARENLKERVSEITNGHMADVIYEPVGGDIFDKVGSLGTHGKCLRCVADEGRLLVVGFASGRIPKIPANLPLVKIFSIVGVAAGESMRRHPEKVKEMMERLKELTGKGLLKPRVQIFPLPKYKEAFRAMAERKLTGKAVIDWESNSAKL